MEVTSTAPDPPTPPRPAAASVALWCYRLFPLALLPAMLVLSRDFGVTWDERYHELYGRRVFEFLATGAQSDWFRPGRLYIHLGGGLFDALCVALQRLLPGDAGVTRHYANAFFGWVTIVYTGRLGRRLGGTSTGLLAMALLALSPRFFAHSMNNPSDVPFAAFATAAVFYLSGLRPTYPFLGWRQAVPLALSVALALNVRAGAVLLLAYVAVVLVGLTLAARATAPRRVAATAGRLAVLTVTVLVAGTVFWPWARADPLVRPFEALRELSRFDADLFVLFDGAWIPAVNLPWDYVPRWALVTFPPVVLVGALLSAGRILRLDERSRWLALGTWGAALLPVAYVIVTRATLYDEIRHVLFAYPPLVAVAALGWTGALGARASRTRTLAAAALALGLAEPAVFQWRNHPNQCVYFNPLAGGPRGAFARFDLDYWGNSVLQALEWADRVSRDSGVPLVVSGAPSHIVCDDAERFRSLRCTRIERARHQLEVLVLRGPASLVTEWASRPDVLHRVTTADGTTLSIVVPGPRFADVEDQLELGEPRTRPGR
jgi:4-amino-4-deoxy-L-arabinose transferase-like glycosyltransferase